MARGRLLVCYVLFVLNLILFVNMVQNVYNITFDVDFIVIGST
jgi:hypothetical protein